LANFAFALRGGETVDVAEWSRDRMEKTARETGPLGLSDFVRHALELEYWRRPSAEEATKRIAAERRTRYG
jgi:hypothetical protein